MADSKKPASGRVRIVWPRTGAIAQPLAKDLQKWLDQGWKRVEPETKEPETKENGK